MRSSKPIMLIEDDTVDAMTVERAFKELKVKNELVHKIDGEDAMEFLGDQNNEKPCIILLDLNMPRMNGIEFLKIVKSDDNLKSIPIVILTTSKSEQDKVESFRLSVEIFHGGTNELDLIVCNRFCLFYHPFRDINPNCRGCALLYHSNA